MNLEVAPGEFFAILGPSGSGKSSLLRIIAGLETPTSGEIHIVGKEVTFVSPKDRNVAMVFQNYALYPHMTVRENIAFGLKIRGLNSGEIATRISEASQMLRIEALLDRKPRQLSGGEKQRVALARALVKRPAVFLLDEPLSNLDAALRHDMRAEILRLQRKLGAAMIYVTHDQTEALAMAERMALLRQGKIEQLGTPEELYQSPHNAFVARFIGTPPMNIFPLRVEKTSGGCRLLGPENLCWEIRKGRTYKALEAWGFPPRILVGIRPEDMKISGNGEKSLTLPSTVEFSELVSSEKWVYLKSPVDSLMVKIPSRENVAPQSRLTLFVSPDHLHLFREEA